MATRARIRQTFDFGRVREGMRGPGADTRIWVATARVDDDPDAIRWERDHGWIVDVTFTGGPLDQEGPVPCRVAKSFATKGGTRSEPFSRGCEVIVEVTEGDPNANPIIVGQLHNQGGCEAPTTVNGVAITESKALGAHILKTPHEVEWEADGLIRLVTNNDMTLQATGTKAQLLAQLIELADNGATQAYIRGTDFAAALNTLLSAWGGEVTAALAHANFWGAQSPPSPLAPAAATGAAWATALTTLQTAISTFQARLVPGDLLSNRIKGE